MHPQSKTWDRRGMHGRKEGGIDDPFYGAFGDPAITFIDNAVVSTREVKPDRLQSSAPPSIHPPRTTIGERGHLEQARN